MTPVATVRAILPGALFALLGIVTLAAARRGERAVPFPGDRLSGLAGPLLIAGGIILIVLDLLHFE